MRKIVALLAITALCVAAATAYASTKTVSWKTGSKTTVKIGKGSSVKWVWTDGQPHNVKGPGVATKVVTGKGKSVTHRFTKRGKFTYICQVHSSMKTVVKVG